MDKNANDEMLLNAASKPVEQISSAKTGSATAIFDLPTFKCAECNYQSIWKHAVKRHEKIHTKEEEFFSRSQPETLDDHEPHKCDFEHNCKKKCDECTTNSNRKRFRKDHRKEISEKQLIKTKRVYNRGKYANIPVKTTKNGLFECEHCSYQTAIRTALVKHQTNHLKNSNT